MPHVPLGDRWPAGAWARCSSPYSRLCDRTDPLAQRQPFEGDLEILFVLPSARLDQTEGLFPSLDVPLSIPFGEEKVVPFDDIIKR